eukprot:423888_1
MALICWINSSFFPSARRNLLSHFRFPSSTMGFAPQQCMHRNNSFFGPRNNCVPLQKGHLYASTMSLSAGHAKGGHIELALTPRPIHAVKADVLVLFCQN